MEVIAYDFCRWLSAHQLTVYQMNMPIPIEIDFKPPAHSALKQKSTPGKPESQK
ncbi:MAG: hypothetical protein KDD45_17845 [Bdellovibrionales bacterium]|nr:hypothetical protein [Bdellovibrionales bacterium]